MNSRGYAAFFTFPCLMHVAHTRIRWMRPSISARTFCKLGSQRRRVLLCACLILLPLMGLFPQIAQTFAIGDPDVGRSTCLEWGNIRKRDESHKTVVSEFQLPIRKNGARGPHGYRNQTRAPMAAFNSTSVEGAKSTIGATSMKRSTGASLKR